MATPPTRRSGHGVAATDVGWRSVFAEQPTDDVQEALDVTRWWLRGAAAAPDVHPSDVTELFWEIERDAAGVLAARRTVPAPTRLGAALDVVKRRLDVAGFIRHRAGVEYRALPNGELVTRCPLGTHPDRTPSFFVNPGKGLWLCRGCGRGGSVVDFELFWTGDDLRTVIARLAWEAGLGPAHSPSVPGGSAGLGLGPVPLRPGGRRRG